MLSDIHVTRPFARGIFRCLGYPSLPQGCSQISWPPILCLQDIFRRLGSFQRPFSPSCPQGLYLSRHALLVPCYTTLCHASSPPHSETLSLGPPAGALLPKVLLLASWWDPSLWKWLQLTSFVLTTQQRTQKTDCKLLQGASYVTDTTEDHVSPLLSKRSFRISHGILIYIAVVTTGHMESVHCQKINILRLWTIRWNKVGTSQKTQMAVWFSVKPSTQYVVKDHVAPST